MNKLRALVRAKFPHSPPAYVTAFLILHEVTAIVPLPLIYFSLPDSLTASSGNWKSLFPTDRMEFISTKLEKLTHAPSVDMVIKATIAYSITKILLPARIAISLYYTPALGYRLQSIATLLKRRKS